MPSCSFFRKEKKKRKDEYILGTLRGRRKKETEEESILHRSIYCSSSYGRRNCFGDIFVAGGGEGGGEERFCRDKIFSIIQSYIFIRNEIGR